MKDLKRRFQAFLTKRYGDPRTRFGRAKQSLRVRLLDARITIALAIALVATFAAATTFRGEWWDFAGSGCTRTLAEAHTYEIVRDQAMRTRRTTHAGLQTEYQSHIAEARQLLDRASRLRRQGAGGEREAGLLTVGAQLQNATARTLIPVLQFTDPRAALFAAEDQLSETARTDLREALLRKQCPHRSGTSAATTTAADTFVDDLGADVKNIHKTARDDFIMAAGLTAVLVLLAISEYTRRDRSIFFAVLAVPVFGYVVVHAVKEVDPSLAEVYGVAVGVYAAILIVTLIVMVQYDLWPENASQPPPSAANAGAAVPERRRMRLLVPLLTTATLVNAVAGVTYSAFKGDANVGFAEAQSLDLSTLRRSAAFEDRAYTTIDGMRRLREADLSARAVAELLNAPHDGKGAADRYLWDRDAVRWQAAIQLLAQKKPSENSLDSLAPPLKAVAKGEYGPYDDPMFPVRYYVDRTIKIPAMLFAERDALNEHSAQIEGQADLIVGALAALAIAVYLATEGLRLRDRGGEKKSAAPFVLSMFAGAGLLTALLLGVIAYLTISSVPQLEVEATLPANCAASGETLKVRRDVAAALCFAAAEEALKLNDHQTAALLYEEAAEIRSDFAIARYLAALTSIANPPYGSRDRTIAAEREVMEDVKALGRGPAITIVGNLGYQEFLLGLETGDERVLKLGMDDTATAAKLGFKDRALGYRHAIASLAYGMFVQSRLTDEERRSDHGERRSSAAAAIAKADEIYRHGGVGADYTVSRPAGAARSAIAAGALGDLELLREHCTTVMGGLDRNACDAKIDGLAPQVVVNMWGARPSRNRFVGRPVFRALPGGLAWDARAGQNAVARDDVVVVLMSKSDGAGGWRFVPELTEQISSAALTRGNGWQFRSLLTATHDSECLQQSDYRADLYVNGQRIGPKVAGGSYAVQDLVGPVRYRTATFRELGVASCYPQQWKRARVELGALSGSYREDDAGRGMMVHAFFDGRSPKQRDVPRAIVQLAVERTLRSIGRPSLGAPKAPPPRRACEPYASRNRAESYLAFSRAAAMVFAKAWRTADGLDEVGIVWQERNDHDELSCGILSSMVSAGD
jgi:hypothetical protein